MGIQKENENSDTVPKTVCLHLFEATRWLMWFPTIYPLNLRLALDETKHSSDMYLAQEIKYYAQICSLKVVHLFGKTMFIYVHTVL